MKIVKTEFKKDCKSILTSNSGKKLTAVTLTVKNWLGRKKTIDAYPTTYGPTFGSGSILYLVFVDEHGREFDDDISKQINNWIRNQEILGLLPL